VGALLEWNVSQQHEFQYLLDPVIPTAVDRRKATISEMEGTAV
jgi:hypothetical protein